MDGKPIWKPVGLEGRWMLCWVKIKARKLVPGTLLHVPCSPSKTWKGKKKNAKSVLRSALETYFTVTGVKQWSQVTVGTLLVTKRCFLLP